ncbi:uncharacterized protein LOC134684308 [Mytilus trossulus]|uniref:uncharacterized protein LOC134684308 n=1 Tax=Mytilus trossulus TaxID=6551 RepID=UPI003005D05A
MVCQLERKINSTAASYKEQRKVSSQSILTGVKRQYFLTMCRRTAKVILLFLFITVLTGVSRSYPAMDNSAYDVISGDAELYGLDKRYKWKCNGWFKWRCGNSKMVHREIRNIDSE